MKTKIIYLLFLFTLALYAKSQSALSSYALPEGSPLDLRLKGDVKIDPSGNVWIAFTGRKYGTNLSVSSIGLAQWNGSVWTTYNKDNSSLPTNYLTSLEFDGTVLWIGTKNGLVKKNNTTWTIYNKSNSGIISDSVNDVKVKNGIVWIATDNGISKFDGTTWTNFSKNNSSILNDIVTSIDADNNGNIWCGTPVGLSKLNGGIFTNYTSANSGLKKDNINIVYVDTKGNVWISGDDAPNVGNGYAGIYKVVNGVIKAIQDMIDYCSQGTLPPKSFSFSSDQDGKVYLQGMSPNVHLGINTATITDIGSQNITSFNLNQFNMQYQPNGLLVQTDFSGNIWFAGRDGFPLHGDSLYKFNPANYIRQSIDTVSNGEKISYLNVNKVSTPILTKGDMFWDLTKGGYEVPKGTCKKSIFASALWIGGVVNGNIKVAAQTYRQNGNEYGTGPLSIGSATVDPITSASYNKIWNISRWEIDEFRTNYSNPGYQIPTDILTWPAHGDTTKGQSWNLAPFVNVGGLPNKYEPTLGDYPLIKGDQMLYWVFNDQTFHGETQSFPLGVEVHASAYAFKCDDINDMDSNTAINYTTLYHYDIFNRTNATIDSLKVGMWTDVDLGNYNDDYIGCNPKEGYGYVYNSDSMDEGWQGYGTNPPALAVVQLKGTTHSSGADMGMKNFVYYGNNWSTQGNPQNLNHYWNYLNSRWKDGTPIKYANTNDTTSFMYPGKDDLAGRPEWSEITAGDLPGDRRFLMATGPVSFLSGEIQSVDYAIVYSRTSSSAIPVLPKLESDVKRVKKWFNANIFPSCLSVNGISEVHANTFQRLIVYPNPANNILSLQYVARTKMVNYEVYDLTGRMMLKGNINESNTISVQVLNAGLYIIKLVDGGEVHSAKFMKQ